MANQRKMVNLSVEETSGVDHPAHLHEGWIIKKSAADAATVAEAFGLINTTKEAPVPVLKKNEDGTVTLTQADYDALTATAAAAAPAADDAAAPAAADDAAAAPAADDAAPAAAPAEGEAAEKAALLKSLPENLRAMFKANEDALSAARADIAKERDTRLDGEAITKARDAFKSLAIDVTKTAPALRRIALIDPELAKSVETALKAADAQLAAGGTLTKELGTSTAPADSGEGAFAQITAKAREIHAANGAPTFEQAFTKAIESNPELYKAYVAEKAGK